MDNYNALITAEDFFMQEKYKEAKRIYESIIDKIDDCDALHTYGLCLVRLKEYDRAIEIFLKIINTDQNLGDVWYSLGRTYLIIDDFENAIRALHCAEGCVSNDSDVHFYLGMCFEKVGQFSQAIESYQKALSLCDSVEVHINISFCYFYSGNQQLALRHIKTAFEMDPDNLECLCYLVYFLIKLKKGKKHMICCLHLTWILIKTVQY